MYVYICEDGVGGCINVYMCGWVGAGLGVGVGVDECIFILYYVILHIDVCMYVGMCVCIHTFVWYVYILTYGYMHVLFFL